MNAAHHRSGQPDVARFQRHPIVTRYVMSVSSIASTPVAAPAAVAAASPPAQPAHTKVQQDNDHDGPGSPDSTGLMDKKA